MKISILTLFPEQFEGFMNTSIIKKALLQDFCSMEIINIRDFTKDKHRRVDDKPYGGGAGLVMSCQPVVDALRSVKTDNSYTIYLSPAGKTFNQAKAHQLKEIEHLILLCGHYEGIDERILSYVDEELSIGDYVLTGGELGAMVVSDALIRLLPGVISEASIVEESFEQGLLEYPHYTLPAEFEGQQVPEVLMSGHHERIRQWRLKHALKKTLENRPDLLEQRTLSAEEAQFLEEIQAENCQES